MSVSELTEWRVHLGAHKTGSTHLQDSLAARADEIASLGANFVARDQSRPLLRSQSRAGRLRRRLERHLPVLRPHLSRVGALQLRRGLASHVRVPGALVLSEEDLLGDMACLLDGKLYPELDRLAILGRAAGKVPVTLFLAVRSFDGLLPSVYAERLKYRQHAREELNRAISMWRQDPPSWSRLVRRIAQRLPNAKIRIWDYGDYKQHWPAIHALVSGANLSPASDIGRPASTRRPSINAILAAEAMPDAADWSVRASKVRALYAEDIGSGIGERFDPMSDHDKAFFLERHAEDLEAIERELPGTRLRF